MKLCKFLFNLYFKAGTFENIYISQVVVNQPVPEVRVGSGSVEDTLLLLEMVREKQQQENRKLKEERIREMGLEQKLKNERQRGRASML